MMGLTERQLDVLNAIRGFIAENGFSPSHREIAAAVGIKSAGRVNEIINALEERGYIRRCKRAKRSIELVEQDPLTTLRAAWADASKETREAFLTEVLL